jgi:hypothetical protein
VKSLLTAVSCSLALAASVFLLVFPSGRSGYWGGQYHTTTLLQEEGLWVLIPLSFPVVVTLLPLVFPKQAVRILASIIIWAFAILGGFSIGLFYIPSAVVVLLGACVDSS